MGKRVIIPKFDDGIEEKYFSPRFICIQKGETIEWINFDTKPHTLIFIPVKPPNNYNIPSLGPIKPDAKISAPFNFDCQRIDYYCNFHILEKGSIVILPKDEKDMSNTEHLRFLQNVFDIPTPDILHHLKS